MELANRWATAGAGVERVRGASHEDAGAITALLRDAAASHVHVDWHYPADWLGSPGFVLVESAAPINSSFTNRLFGGPSLLEGCLAVAADPAPAAWVRVAAVEDESEVTRLLGAMLSRAAPFLAESGATHLGWLPVQEWPERSLTDLGFRQENVIETFVKETPAILDVDPVPGLTFRRVRDRDMPRLAEIEAAAFEPLWRHSAAGLRLARNAAFSFDVVEKDGRLAGFQFSTRNRSGAHLARMTIHPDFQRAGIGRALLRHTLLGYEALGLRVATLNTQADNHASRRLYQRFGFQPSGERYPVWVARW